MTDARTRRRTGQRRAARVGKEVQRVDGPPGAADGLHDEIPVCRLLREDARMLEVHRLDVERQLAIFHLPVLRQAQICPLAAAGRRPGVARVILPPERIVLRRVPDHLRIWTHKDIFAPAFELFAAGGIKDLIVLPSISQPHTVSPVMDSNRYPRSIDPVRSYLLRPGRTARPHPAPVLLFLADRPRRGYSTGH